MNREQLKEFLDRDPIGVKDNDDGSQYIDIVTIETHLDSLDLLWGTEDFKFRVITIGDFFYGSASVVVTINLLGQKRRLVGAATRLLAGDISHSEPILLSECIKNGVKPMGKIFGKYLNERGEQQESLSGKKKNKRTAVKMPPDKTIMQKYLQAVAKGDQDTMEKLTSAYDIKVPENA